MIAGQEFRWPPRIFGALTITPAFFVVVRSLSAIISRDRIEHETATLLIRQNPAFAAHAFGHQNSHHTRRPDHAGGMKLDELHVDQICTCVISERVTVASVLPTVLVILYARPIPPVANTTALARKILKRPRSRS